LLMAALQPLQKTEAELYSGAFTGSNLSCFHSGGCR
jgi:hypothetical protein